MNRPKESFGPALYEAPAIEREVTTEELTRESQYAGTDPAGASQGPVAQSA